LVIEMFWAEGQLLVNEMAPRPHNSFHATEVACVTSQFEQLVRAVCDLPLGSVEVTRPAAIVNLLGDLWSDRTPAFDRALAIPGERVHLYGKRVARPGRKMGHLSAVGYTPEEALARVQAAATLNSGRLEGQGLSWAQPRIYRNDHACWTLGQVPAERQPRLLAVQCGIRG